MLNPSGCFGGTSHSAGHSTPSIPRWGRGLAFALWVLTPSPGHGATSGPSPQVPRRGRGDPTASLHGISDLAPRASGVGIGGGNRRVLRALPQPQPASVPWDAKPTVPRASRVGPTHHPQAVPCLPPTQNHPVPRARCVSRMPQTPHGAPGRRDTGRSPLSPGSVAEPPG